jgi:non-specific serine/threonine protein kinase
MRRLLVLIGVLAVGACSGGPAPPLPAEPGASGPQWRRAAAAPSERTEVAAAAAGDDIVVVGGFLGSGFTVPSVEILDTKAGTWREGPDLPEAVNHAMAATVNGAVHVFGGYLASQTPSASAFRLDGDRWVRLAPMPAGRAAGTAAAVDGTVYVAGGIGPGGLAEEMFVYDAAADRWSTAPGPPTRREHLGGAAFGGIFYTVGGRASGVAGILSAFEAYDPGKGEWSRLPDLPTPRGGLAASATCNGLVVAVGGEARATFPEAEAFNTRTRKWFALPPLPTPRHGLGVVGVGPTLYTLSGGPRPGLHVSAATEAIDLSSAGPCPT